ncbi:MAG: hypothetical protein COC01_09745 [Bacteroidetes bacterium]|nr:MAG: hypothetical protein COC01_09745 [Bacteroidota bacterium]
MMHLKNNCQSDPALKPACPAGRLHVGKTIPFTSTCLSGRQVVILNEAQRSEPCLPAGRETPYPYTGISTRGFLAVLGMTIIIYLLSAANSLAQTYNFDNFTVEHGLAQSQILSVCQDRQGNIWFGTNGGGVSKYDGSKFTTYAVRDGLADNIVYSIIEDQSGNLWFGTNNGLSRFDGSRFTNYDDKNGLSHNRVYEVFEDKEGVVWLGTFEGVNIMEQDSIVVFDKNSLLKNAAVSCIYQDKLGHLWFGTSVNGAVRYNPDERTGNQFKAFTKKEGLMHNVVRTINEDASGIIWIGTWRGASQIINDSVINRPFSDDKDYQESVISSALDRDGNLWFGTYSLGAVRYDGENFKRYTKNNGLISKAIWSVLCDREGNIWFGSLGNGVSKFRGEAFVNYSEKDGLANNNVRCVYEDSKGDFWIGSIGGLSKIKGDVFNKNKIYGRFKSNSPANDLFHIYSHTREDPTTIGNNAVGAVLEDSKGDMWFATRGGGVSKLVLSEDEGFDGSRFVTYMKNDGLTNNAVNSIIEDKKGVIWLGTMSGVTTIDENIQRFEEADQIIGELPVWNIFEDKEGTIWFATEKGAVKYSKGKFQSFTKKDGFVDDRVRSVVQDKKGYLWFGTNSGIFRYDPSATSSESFEVINDTMGLSSNTVYIILFDHLDNLYIGTEKGIDNLNVDMYNKTKEIDIKHYGKQEGFIGIECNTNAGYRDSKGNLWFGTIHGVTIFDPQLDKPNAVEPVTKIENLRLFFEDFNWTPLAESIDIRSGLPIGLTLPYTANHLTFDFIGVSLTIPGKVKYQFKLDGLDQDWFPVTSKNEAVYSNIPEGSYTFIVKAMNNDGVWNKEPTTIDFVILPPWYRTWWFYTLSVLLIFGAIYTVITVRERNLRQQKLKLESEVRARTAQVVKQKEVIEQKNKDITDSINYAKRIQQAILPSLASIEEKFRESFVTFAPRDIVSGDFYWFHAAPPAPPDWGENQRSKSPSYETADPGLYEKMKEKAAEMRNKPTEGEAILWGYLKDKQTGHKIRRQHIIDRFIGDFVCLDKKLVIEVDGDVHDYQKEEDELRTSVLEDRGFRVMRFKNEEVIVEPERVVNQIKETLDKSVSPQRGDGRGAGRAFIAACDCTGHGVPGAFVSMIGNNLLDQIILEKDINKPGEILSMLNRGMKAVFTQKGEQEAQDGMDMALCVIDLENNQLEFAGAQNPLFLIRDGELIETKGDKTPIGGNTEQDYEFTNHIIQLQKDDSLYLFSDGYADQFGGSSTDEEFGKGKKFMKKRYKQLLIGIQDKSMPEQKEILRETFNNWRGTQEQVDDILIIGIKI